MINAKLGYRTPGPMPDLDPRNKQRAIDNQIVLKSRAFIEACEQAGIKPTKRQASRFKNKTGKAWQTKTATK
jgi:hypothetical protein